MLRSRVYTGMSIVEGQGYGKAYFVGRAVQNFQIEKIDPNLILTELQRFASVRKSVKEYYRCYRETLEDRITKQGENSILKIYEHIIDDPAFTGQVTHYITSENYSLESAIRGVSKEFMEKFNAAGTSYFRDRSSDMVEICEKLVSFLAGEEKGKITFVDDVVLIINRSFTPSDLINYDMSKIKAVISISAGRTSHAAILARSYSIPVVSGIDGLAELVSPNEPILVDADTGTVTVFPSDEAIDEYHVYTADIEHEKKCAAKKWKGPVYTRDGITITVMANISFESDVQLSVENGADGIGLVRTEYLLSERENFPTEEEQFVYYSHIFESTKPNQEIIIRVMDIGGDKAAKFLRIPKEENPFMGWRAVRILLEKRELFETQLRAILRAGEGRQYGIMFPMVTALSEWREIRAFTMEVSQKVGITCPPLGILFEVPLAILEIEFFLKEIEFASIGTNDLLQYLSAADRNNNKVNYLYNPAEPAFLRIIKNAIDRCKDKGIPISICGEMAGNPEYTLLLVGLGLLRFSVVPNMIPLIKEIVNSVSCAEIREEIVHILSVESSEHITDWVKKNNAQYVGSIFKRYHLEQKLLSS